MPTNIEIKARVHDRAAIELRAARLTDQAVQIIPQVDTFFLTQKGRLKLRELTAESAQLVYYERPDHGGPKRSDYSIFETKDAPGLRDTLGRALGIRGIVKKVRSLYLIGQTRLHLDQVEGLGSFMELEVVLRPDQSEAEGKAIAVQLMAELGIPQSDLLEGAYMDLLEQGAQETGHDAEPAPKVKSVNHVAVIVGDLERSITFWRDALGMEVSQVRDVPSEESRVAFLPLQGSEVELVQPTSSGSGLARFLSKRGPGMHHICLEVTDLEAMLTRLKTRGIRLINGAARTGTDGVRYAFVHPESTGGVLIELYQT